MNHKHFMVGVVVASCAALPAYAADKAAGKTTATAVCAACHGANGVSVAPTIPNLAGQKEKYLAGQLKAFKGKRRKHPIMGPIAAQLSGAQIANVSAFFASLAGAADSAAKSKPLANLISRKISFPANFKSGFTHYTTLNNTRRKQLRKYWANKIALDAARAGNPLPEGSVLVVEAFKAKLGADKKPVKGADGMYVATKLAGYTAMERRAGWGNDFPEILRNGDWQYGIFKPDQSLRAGRSQAACLACHKPHANISYVFTLKALQDAARK